MAKLSSRGASAGVDVVVIGSGPGGLTAALALARQGQRVLVLEQHYLPGGWTHSFTLEGYRFSPGVHYLGQLQPGGSLRRLYEGLGVGRHLEFLELNPDGFDHFLVGDARFDQPRGQEAWRARLARRFPREQQGLDRYFGTLNRIVQDVKTCDTKLDFPRCLTIPFAAPTLVRWGLRTHAALLDHCITDPTLRAVLSATSGNHGLAPSRVSLPIHCTVTDHYFEGGWYPRGGARRLPNALIRELRRHGGAIRTSCRVMRILVRSGRAVGVELESGEQIAAEHVVCNADPAVLYRDLLEPEVCRSQLRRVDRMEYSASMVSVFAAVELDLEELGLDSGNYWIYGDDDVDGLYRRMERELPGDEVSGLFLTVTSLKDPGHVRHGHHTIEMFVFVPHAPFARWAGEEPTVRAAAYQELKRSIADKMLRTAERRLIPGLRRSLRFLEVGSPLTNDHYCASHRGAVYGTAKTPWQLGPMSFSQRGPIDALHLCGSSTLSHGVAGASMSGLMAAQRVLGLSSVEDLLGPEDGTLRVVDRRDIPADRRRPAPAAAHVEPTLGAPAMGA